MWAVGWHVSTELTRVRWRCAAYHQLDGDVHTHHQLAAHHILLALFVVAVTS